MDQLYLGQYASMDIRNTPLDNELLIIKLLEISDSINEISNLTLWRDNYSPTDITKEDFKIIADKIYDVTVVSSYNIDLILSMLQKELIRVDSMAVFADNKNIVNNG